MIEHTAWQPNPIDAWSDDRLLLVSISYPAVYGTISIRQLLWQVCRKKQCCLERVPSLLSRTWQAGGAAAALVSAALFGAWLKLAFEQVGLEFVRCLGFDLDAAAWWQQREQPHPVTTHRLGHNEVKHLLQAILACLRAVDLCTAGGC